MDDLEELRALMTSDCNFNDNLSSSSWNLSTLNSQDYPPASIGSTLCNLSHALVTQLLANLSLHLHPLIKYPEYYSFQYRLIGTFFQSVIFVVGVLGNILVVVVVQRRPEMRSSTNCFLVSLAVADFLVLVAAVPNEIVSYFLVGDEWVWGRAGCALLIFIQYAGINVSSLCITAFTIERYIAVCYPLQSQAICTIRRAKRIIAGVWGFALCYCSPWLVLTKTQPLLYEGIPPKEKCTFALSRSSYVGYYFADLVVFYVIPLLLSSVLYGLIAREIFASHRNRQLYPKQRYQVTTVSTRISRGTVNGLYAHGPRPVTRAYGNSSSSSNAVQVVKMLVAVAALFAAFWFPYRVWVVYNSLASEPYMELWFLMFAKTMVFINSAVNPILYNLMSTKFRRAFGRMLFCGKDSNPRFFTSALQHSNTMTSSMRSSCRQGIP